VRCLANSLVVPGPDHLFTDERQAGCLRAFNVGVPFCGALRSPSKIEIRIAESSFENKNITELSESVSSDPEMNNDTNSLSDAVTNDEHVYTVHKICQTVTTESRGETEEKCYVRVLETVEGDVTVTINLDSLAQILANKTLSSASGKSRLLNGCVTAIAADVRRTRQDLYRAV
jgi:hypothetical protein